MSEVCIFHHIPKTAGSALREILKKNFGKSFIDHYSLPGAKDRAFYRKYVDTMPRGKRLCLASHSAANVMPILLDEGIPFRAFVMLRDPVDRVVSLYWFVQTLPQDHTGRGMRVFRAIEENGWTLRDIYEHFGGSRPDDSPMHRDFSVFFDFQARSFLTPWRSTDDMAYTTEVREDALETIRGLLERHYVAGTQERYEETVKRFAREFGWKLGWRGARRKVNVGELRKRSDELDAETLEIIRRYNATDTALHSLVSAMV